MAALPSQHNSVSSSCAARCRKINGSTVEGTIQEATQPFAAWPTIRSPSHLLRAVAPWPESSEQRGCCRGRLVHRPARQIPDTTSGHIYVNVTLSYLMLFYVT
jgi:hypothetical protein